MSMSAKATKVTEQTSMDEVLKSPPPDWVNPGGNGAENATADRQSWEVAVRLGLADTLNAKVSAQKPLADGLRKTIRLAHTRGDGLLLASSEKRLADIESVLKRNEALLQHCAAWLGHGQKALETRLREAESALLPVQTEAGDYDGARRLVVSAAPDAAAREAIEMALAPADRSIAAKVGAARHAVEVARSTRDKNTEAIAAGQAKLARLVA